MAKRERKGRTWEGVVTFAGPYAFTGDNATEHFPRAWQRHKPIRVRIVEIVPKSKKAAKRKGKR